MPEVSLNIHQISKPVAGPDAGHSPNAQHGRHQGATVKASHNAVSLVQHAAEELSFAAAERLKKTSSQETTSRTGLPSLAMLQHASEEASFAAGERRTSKDETTLTIGDEDRRARQLGRGAEHYFEKLPDLDRSRIAQLERQLRQDGEASIERLQARLDQFHVDISYQQAALEVLAERLDADTPWHGIVNQLLIRNSSIRDAEILAGLNATRTAIEFESNHHASAQNFRDVHRTLIEFDSVLGTFKNLLDKFGGRDLHTWLLYLSKSIGAELKAAPASSVEPSKLLAILHELSQMKWLITMLENLGERLRRFRHRFHPRGDEDEEKVATSEASRRDKLLLNILTLTEANWVSSDDVERSAETCPPPSIEAKVYLLRELLDFFRSMPLMVFNDQTHRMRLVEAAQDALDSAIDLEES